LKGISATNPTVITGVDVGTIAGVVDTGIVAVTGIVVVGVIVGVISTGIVAVGVRVGVEVDTSLISNRLGHNLPVMKSRSVAAS
jgi:hypothetical protein